MSKVFIPQDYHTPLSVYEMQRAIEFIKSNFQVNLSNALNLRRVSAPLFVDENSGLNDNLNGVERPVSFDIPDVGTNAQVVHSLAKWKRLALKRYDFKVGKGLKAVDFAFVIENVDGADFDLSSIEFRPIYLARRTRG